jgi:hypothetical protein
MFRGDQRCEHQTEENLKWRQFKTEHKLRENFKLGNIRCEVHLFVTTQDQLGIAYSSSIALWGYQ